MAVVTSVSPEVAALLTSKGYQQAPWNNNAWYDPNDPSGNYLTDQSLAALTGATTPVPGAVLDRETGTWTLNGQPVQMTNAQGQVWINNQTPGSKGGQLTGTGYWATPTGGGGGFLNSVLSGVANAISSVASPIADLGPAAPLAIIGGGLAANAGLLGGASSGTAGAASVAPSAATGAITSGPFAGATAAELTAANAGSGAVTGGLGSMASTVPSLAQWEAMTAAGAPVSAGASSVVNGLISAAPQAATTAAGTAGAGKVAAELIPGVPNSVLGAAVGALASGNTSTSTTADKSPWAPAQEWMKANLANGQKLQQQYALNPFSAFQKQAYNNSAQLGNQARSMINTVLPQMNNFTPYQRQQSSQKFTPFNFGSVNLGMTQNPFGA